MNVSFKKLKCIHSIMLNRTIQTRTEIALGYVIDSARYVSAISATHAHDEQNISSHRILSL